MRTAIIYRSFLGSTRKYAEWLHDSIESSDLFKPRQVRDKKLAEYGLVIICSGTYIGWISLRGYLKKKWPVLQGKKVVFLVVGLAPPEAPESMAAYMKIPEHIRQEIQYFKVAGRWGSRNQNQDAVKRENLQPVLEYIQGLTS
jgi:menaquinone-dependent protoporphyrinogen IX oxidase